MKQKKQNIFQDHALVYKDFHTGEVITKTEVQMSQRYIEPAYVKVYLDDLLAFMNVPKGMNQILWSFIKIVDYNGEIVLNATIKKDIALQLGISVYSINAAITVFVKQQVVYRRGTGTYLLNPYFAAKGKWTDIAKIRMEVEYDQNNTKTIRNIEFYKINYKLGDDFVET